MVCDHLQYWQEMNMVRNIDPVALKQHHSVFRIEYARFDVNVFQYPINVKTIYVWLTYNYKMLASPHQLSPITKKYPIKRIITY